MRITVRLCKFLTDGSEVVLKFSESGYEFEYLTIPKSSASVRRQSIVPAHEDNWRAFSFTVFLLGPLRRCRRAVGSTAHIAIQPEPNTFQMNKEAVKHSYIDFCVAFSRQDLGAFQRAMLFDGIAWLGD